MHETRTLEHQGTSTGAVGAMRHDDPLDDWLGDISDADWDEGAARAAGRARTSAGDTERAGHAEDSWLEQAADRPRPAQAVDRADTRRAATERRRYTAGLVLLVVIGLAVGIPVLVLRGDGGAEVTAVEPTTSTPARDIPSARTTTTPATGSSDATATDEPAGTPPSTLDAPASFTLPEGTTIRRGAGDHDRVGQLQ